MSEIHAGAEIAIIGMGYVGGAFADFIGSRFSLTTYDVKDGMEYPQAAIDGCRLAVVCVPTPMAADGSCDTSYVEDAIRKINTPLIMIKSTIPPGTTERLKAETGKRIVFSPEYIGESKYHNPVYRTMSETPFIVCGGESADVREAFEILENIAGPHCAYYGCSATEAELIKYMANCFSAMKISFVNEFYEIAKTFGADWYKVREGWLLDGRIGRSVSSVFADERGFGGKCLPKDISAITAAADSAGYSADILKAVINFNNKLREQNKL